jgi:hypothetical protein
MGQRSFFDVENRLQSVSTMGDPLERLAAAIPWENFRPLLARVHEKERKSDAGRKPIDVVLMFKVLILLLKSCTWHRYGGVRGNGKEPPASLPFLTGRRRVGARRRRAS